MGKHGPPLGTNKKKTFNEVKNASSTYRSTWKAGGMPGFVGSNHVHHVVPCTSLKGSLSDYLSDKTPAYREGLAFFTVWDVNEKYNLMGLPILDAYTRAFAYSKKLNLDRPAWAPKAEGLLAFRNKRTPKYPIHLWKHAEYNDKVYDNLNPIWSKLALKQKAHKAVGAKNLASQVQRVSNSFRRKLMAKNKQTRSDWEATPPRYAQFNMV